MKDKEILSSLEKENLSREEVDYLIEKLCSLTVNAGMTLTFRVETYLKSRERLEDVSRELTARFFHMSSRTLSRKLKKEHTGFHELLNRERQRRCSYYMRCNITCGQEIVELLGLSDVSHFYKSFKQWTGYRFSEAKMMLAENHQNIDRIFHRHNEPGQT